MSDVLFVHNNFPAQFGFIAQKLHSEGHRVAESAHMVALDQPDSLAAIIEAVAAHP